MMDDDHFSYFTKMKKKKNHENTEVSKEPWILVLKGLRIIYIMYSQLCFQGYFHNFFPITLVTYPTYPTLL